MFTVSVSADLRNDIENIVDGVFSPLEGFVGEQDFQSIVKTGRLKNGLAWTVPIVLDVDDQTAMKMKDGGQVALATGSDKFAILHVEETYSFDKMACAKSIYQTDDIKHPGVGKMANMRSRLVGGRIDVARRIEQ